MCKHLGATVIGTVSTPERAKIAKAHGCDHVILYKETDVHQQALRLTNGKGCHAVFSGVGKSAFPADLACTRRKGTLVSYGNSSGVVADFRILDLSKNNVKLVRPTLANYIAERDEFLQRAKELQDLLVTGGVKVQHGGEYSLDAMLQAQDDLAAQITNGQALGKDLDQY